jgi:small conductance mechanosensitive channel
MDQQLADFKRAGDFVIEYGLDILVALLILVVGLLLAKTLNRLIRQGLGKLTANYQLISTMSNTLYVLILLVVVGAAMLQAGIPALIMRRILFAVTLAVVGIIIIFRPYIPSLPFKVGNTIKTGDLLGKVEATTMLNTRLRTFDGKTVFVPNSKILNDYLINYHFTPSRRFELDVGIGYDQDLLRAKQIMETIMIEDPRVLKTPRPVVYLVNLADSCVELSGRGWVDNLKYWKTKCDLLEKVKLRFDQEGITIAFPQRDVHLNHKTATRDDKDLSGSNNKVY